MVATYLQGAGLLPVPVPMASVLDAVVAWADLVVTMQTVDAGHLGIFTRAQLAIILNAYKTALTAPKLGLFTANITPNDTTVIASLIEPAGTWYTAGGKVAVAFNAYQDTAGSLHLKSASLDWPYSGVSPAETVHGWFLTDTF